MSWKFYEGLVRKHGRHGLLVDTNLLMLFLVGTIDPKYISHFKITANHGFTEQDFLLLASLLKKFQRLVTTPHILAEVSNHADKFKEHSRSRIFACLASMVEQLDEQCEPSKSITKTEAFLKFGLTDAAICILSARHLLVLTVDFPLAGYLQKKGIAVINFNNLRRLNWDP